MRNPRLTIFILSAITAIAFWASESQAAGASLENQFDYGRRGAASLVDEEDLTDEFDYYKYRVKFSQEVDKNFSYDTAYQLYEKRYDGLANLNNNFDIASVGARFSPFVKDGFSFTLRPDFDYKAKRYPNKTSQDYNQIRCDLPVILKQESDWTIEVITGINSYEYLNAVKDEFKTKCGIDVKKQFLDGAFDVEAFYTYRYVHREKIADRIERLCGGSAKAKLECPLVKRVEMGLTEGSDNTKTEEEREDSYDYKFLNWYAKAEYGFAAGAVDGFTRYTRLNRVYADFNHDFNGYTLNNSLSYKFFEQGASSSKLKLEYFHKQIRFPYVSSLHLYNNNIVSEMVFTRKDDWKASSAFETRFYKFPFRRTNDKIYYIVKFYAEKRLLKKDLTAGFEYKYTYKNFLHKSAITESAYKLNVTLKF